MMSTSSQLDHDDEMCLPAKNYRLKILFAYHFLSRSVDNPSYQPTSRSSDVGLNMDLKFIIVTYKILRYSELRAGMILFC